MISDSQFKGLFPRCSDASAWCDAMRELFPKYEINTPYRIAAFLAQCGHESGGWRVFSENLNYSAKALDAVFGKYFARGDHDAEEYARNPEAIANVVYANRMGNGPTESGDGWNYRGRGPIQLTGKNNYLAFAEDMDCPEVIDNPDLLSEDPNYGILAAIWFWNENNLNKYSDTQDMKKLTRRINGGYIGLEDRIHHWEEALHALGVESCDSQDHEEDEDDIDLEDIGVLRKGSRGDGVKLMQEALGIDADGIFGAGTEIVLKEWQDKNGLDADGIAGPSTLGQLLDEG